MANVILASMRTAIRSLRNPEIAEHSARFFKSGKGEYGEGDQFLGVRVPLIRRQVKRFRDAPQRAVVEMLKSQYHEERLFAVLLLVEQYKRGNQDQRDRVFSLYMQHRDRVNNWDIVDSSAHLIVGPHLEKGGREVLSELAKSAIVWDRRIAMMATYHFIRLGDFGDALAIATILRDDEHDLIQKVVGWMLREIGKRDRQAEEDFLQQHYKTMPRTMLRYAIEKFPEGRRKAYLNGKV